MMFRQQNIGTRSLSERVPRLQTKVHVLVFMFILLAVLYIGTFVFVIAYLSGGSSELGNGRSESSLCFKGSDVSFLKKFSKDVDEFQTKEDGDDLCFDNTSWIPRVTSKMYSFLNERMDYLDEQMGGIQTASTPRESNVQGLVSIGQVLRPAYSYRRFSHLYLDITSKYSETESIGPLKWTKSGIEGSHVRGMSVDASSGQLKILQSGYYFIYSHVMYDVQSLNKVSGGYGPRRPVHSIFKNYSSADGRTKLLESSSNSQGPTSFLQGIFLLQADDVLVVCTAIDLLYTDSGRFSYFGAYLI